SLFFIAEDHDHGFLLESGWLKLTPHKSNLRPDAGLRSDEQAVANSCANVELELQRQSVFQREAILAVNSSDFLSAVLFRVLIQLRR
ncbi:hypothetical protein INR49_031555, partial [Caranx melampygus]